jgi:hypothetical protein
MAAARRRGKWLGGRPVLGYDVDPQTRHLVVNQEEAALVRAIFELYLELGGLIPTVVELSRRGWLNKSWTTRQGIVRGGKPFSKGTLHYLLTNVTYLGQVKYQDQVFEGDHEAIVAEALFQGVQTMLGHNWPHRGGLGNIRQIAARSNTSRFKKVDPAASPDEWRSMAAEPLQTALCAIPQPPQLTPLVF